MKKARGGTRKRTGSNGCCTLKNQRKPVDLEAVRQKITSLVANKAYAMVRGEVEDIEKKGNLPAMKYLFEMIGLFPATNAQEQSPGDDCLAETLLQRLGIAEESGEPQVTKDSPEDAAVLVHTVE